MNDNGKSNSKDAGNGSDQPPQRLSDDGETAAAAATNEAEKFKNEYLYPRAEFENYKKQAIKERSDFRKYGCERLAVDLLAVLDIFETALASETTPENLAVFRKGIDMTASELRNVLQRHGVTEIASKGQPFDPSMHEALSSEESATVAPRTITQVFKKPYKLHDRVIRPGQVVVAKEKS